ncbi:MAG: hypothetical protein JOY66_10420 [Acetobacteraceae bacterium]|nr:hypothetical protein [Acetobacteraceae bacterium]
MRLAGSWIIGPLILTGVPASGQPSGDPAAGKAFALQVCTPCHVVAPDQLSPQRFAVAPDFNAIANTPAMSPMALHAFLSGAHPTMPNLVLSPDEERNVIAYILSLRHR